MLLLYIDRREILTNTLEAAQKLINAMKMFCMHNDLKTNIILFMNQNKEKPCIHYNDL